MPTSALVFPLAFLALFVLEVKLVRRRVVNLMLHVDEFAQERAQTPRPAYRLGDLLPRIPGGIKAKLWLRERDPMNLHRTVRALLERLRPHDFRTLQQIYQDYRGVAQISTCQPQDPNRSHWCKRRVSNPASRVNRFCCVVDGRSAEDSTR